MGAVLRGITTLAAAGSSAAAASFACFTPDTALMAVQLSALYAPAALCTAVADALSACGLEGALLPVMDPQSSKLLPWAEGHARPDVRARALGACQRLLAHTEARLEAAIGPEPEFSWRQPDAELRWADADVRDFVRGPSARMTKHGFRGIAEVEHLALRRGRDAGSGRRCGAGRWCTAGRWRVCRSVGSGSAACAR